MDYTIILSTIITAVIAPILIMVAKAAFDLLKAKTQDARIHAVLEDVSASVETSAGVWLAAYADAQKTLSADGKFDNHDLQLALTHAATECKKTLTTESVQFLETNGITVTAYLQDKIKAKVMEVDV